MAQDSWLRRWRTDVLLVVLVLVVAGPIVQVLMAHQASRIAFTAAVWDEGTVAVDTYADILSVDFAEREVDGRVVTYSDKAPGQPFLVAPLYGLARAVGAESPATENPFDNYTLWWTSLWSATIPLAALAVMIRRFCLGVLGDGRAATAAALTTTFGTLLLPFGTVLFGHVMAAALCFGCYLAARERDATPPRLALAGLQGGLAVLTEYTSGIVVVAVGVLALRRHGAGVLAFVAGGVPAVVALGAYNAIAWGSPLEFSYDNSATFSDFHAQGLFGIRIPDPRLTLQVLAGERGLLTMTPIVGVGVAGLVSLARERRHREVGVVGLAVLAAFVAVQGGWFSVTAGASPGPRYVVAALPFIAVGVARAWRWSRGLVVATGALGTLVMLAAVFTNPLAQPTETFTAGHWIWRLATDRWGQTLLTPFLGDPAAQLVQLAIAGGVLALVWRSTTAATTPTARTDAAEGARARTGGERVRGRG